MQRYSKKIHLLLQLSSYSAMSLNQENNPTLATFFHSYVHHQEILKPREIEHPILHLKICNIIEKEYYTGIPIIVKVVLVNPVTGDVANCAEAIEVEVVALKEEFNFEDDQEWSPEYFSGKIAEGKDGRGLLRDVDRQVSWKEGVGSVQVSFKHSRQWFGKCMYRFGARIVGHHTGTRMREAKTEAFWVLDRRCMKKRDRALLLTDKIWQIQGIGKNGGLADLLIKSNIVTVKDLLIEHNLYLDRLKQIFEVRKFSKKFEAICKNALSCELDSKRYLYPSPEIGQSSAVFNSVGELLGMMLKGDQYVSVEKISEADKVCGQKLVALAYQNWNAVEHDIKELTMQPYVLERKRQQAKNLYQTESSCSMAVKRRRISARDPAVERAITDDNFAVGDIIGLNFDSLPPDNTAEYYIPSLLDNILYSTDYIDNGHDLSWFPDSEVESFTEYQLFDI